MTIEHGGKVYEVWLVDSGTMDTEITVNGESYFFDCEYAAEHRDENGAMTEEGLRQLGLEAIRDLGDNWQGEQMDRDSGAGWIDPKQETGGAK